jgi:hypothetical protein
MTQAQAESEHHLGCGADTSAVLEGLIEAANRQVVEERIFTDRKIDVFGRKDNTLDPLQFGDQVRNNLVQEL